MKSDIFEFIQIQGQRKIKILKGRVILTEDRNFTLRFLRPANISKIKSLNLFVANPTNICFDVYSKIFADSKSPKNAKRKFCLNSNQSIFKVSIETLQDFKYIDVILCNKVQSVQSQIAILNLYFLY